MAEAKIMPTFQHILFPVDFSEQNTAIAPHVVCMARRYKARVTLLDVVEIPSVADPVWPAYGTTVDVSAVIEERKQRLELFLKEEFRDIPTTRAVLEGDAAW